MQKVKPFARSLIGPPAYPGDKLSRTKESLGKVGTVILLVLLLVAAIFFAVYDAQHRITSITVETDQITVDHIVVLYQSNPADCYVVAYIYDAAFVNSRALATSPVGSFGFVEILPEDPITGQPITDFSNYQIQVGVYSSHGNGACTNFGSYQSISIALVSGPIPPDIGVQSSFQQNFLYFGTHINSVLDVSTVRTVYSNGTTVSVFKQSTRYASQLTQPAYLGYCSFFFSNAVQVVKYETSFGLFKRILVDIGSAFTVASLIAALFVYVTIRIMYDQPHTWVNHEVREAVLYTMAAPNNTGSTASTTPNTVNVNINGTP